jgi:hypothetical protein
MGFLLSAGAGESGKSLIDKILKCDIIVLKTMSTPHSQRCRLGSDYRTVMRKPVLEPWMIAISLLLALILVSAVVIPAGKWVWESLNLPVLTLNPYKHVVKVTEADGRVLTKDNAGDRFDRRVEEIKKAGRYEIDHTGRLDGRP